MGEAAAAPAAVMVTSLEVYGGVDTHAATHTAALVDASGGVRATQTFATDAAGCRRLVGWLAGGGQLRAVGVEQTGTYGAGVARLLAARGVVVLEVGSVDRQTRRRDGKDDTIDAVAAARAALAGRAAPARCRSGELAALQVLVASRNSALRVARSALQQLRAELVRAPEPLRGSLGRLGKAQLLRRCAAFPEPPVGRLLTHLEASRLALRQHARSYQQRRRQLRDLEQRLKLLVEALDGSLLAIRGVGPITASQLLLTAGGNPERMRSEASFAKLCGAAPLPASSGQTQPRRHRLNRGGDRQANCALHQIAVTRLRCCPTTAAYATRRLAEGKSKREVMRCLKRYIARQLYRHLSRHLTAARATSPSEAL